MVQFVGSFSTHTSIFVLTAAGAKTLSNLCSVCLCVLSPLLLELALLRENEKEEEERATFSTLLVRGGGKTIAFT